MSTTITTPDGIALHVEVDGPADAPVTVVLLHGWTLDGRTWGPVTRELRKQGLPVRVIRPDHRAHGRSATSDAASMTIDQLADDAALVLSELAPTGPLVLVGHSMGGMTLMALADRHPEVYRRVAGVGLVSTASGGLAALTLGLPPKALAVFQTAEKWLFANERWRGGKRMGDPRLLAPALNWLLLGRSPSRHAVRTTHEVIAACRPATVAGYRPTLDSHERDAALAAFASIPTVLLAGSRDRLTPVRYSERIHEALPSAEFTVVPDAGHMLPVERVDDVTGAVAGLVRHALETPPAGASAQRAG